MHPAVSNGSYDVARDPRGFPDPVDAGLRQAAGLSRQRRLGAKAAGRARPADAGLHVRIRQRASRPALSRERRDRRLRGRAREGARVPEREAAGRDHLHPQRHRGDQSGGVYVCARAHPAGRRDRGLHHGAPFQHRAVAFPARAPGRGHQMGAGRRRRQLPHRRIREAAHAAHQAGRDDAHVECARHHHADQGGRAACPCARHSGAGRRRAGRGASRSRRAGPRLRLLRRSPATSCTARPGSARCTASTSTSPRCRRSTAAAR